MEGMGMMKAQNPKVSVIMLTYNREHLVSRAIESVLSQTFTDFEFIIVNNGSSDTSGKIADSFALKDDRVVVIHRERGNIGSGRNTGFDLAKGDYIAFIDDDDWCEPDFLEFLYALIHENDADVAICGAAHYNSDTKLIMTAEEATLQLMFRKLYNVAFPTKMFNRRLSNIIRFPEDDKYDDITQMPKLLAYSNKVAYHGLPKYTFYRHESNNSAWTTNHSLLDAQILDEYLKSYHSRTEWLSELFPNSASAWSYFEWSFMISMVEKIIRLNIVNCDSQLALMKMDLIKHKVAIYKI